MIESCFHFRKLVIAALLRVLGKWEQGVPRGGYEANPRDDGPDPRSVGGNGKEIHGIPLLFI